jgi:hypothetical protein
MTLPFALGAKASEQIAALRAMWADAHKMGNDELARQIRAHITAVMDAELGLAPPDEAQAAGAAALAPCGHSTDAGPPIALYLCAGQPQR